MSASRKIVRIRAKLSNFFFTFRLEKGIIVRLLTNLFSMGSLLALISIIAGSTYSAFGKLLLDYVPPIDLVLFGQVLTVVILFMVFGMITEWKRFFALSKKEKWAIIIVAFFGGVAGPLLFYSGLMKTSAINAVLLGRVEPLVASLISLYWLREKSSSHQLLGALGIGFGTLIIVTEGFSKGFSTGAGDMLIIFSAICFALGSSVFKKYASHISVELVVLMRNVAGCVMILAVAPFFFEQSDFVAEKAIDQGFWKMLAAFCLVTILASQTLWYRALEIMPATQASTISLSLPFFGVIWVILLLDEKIFDYHIAGGIFIIAGLTFTMWHKQLHPLHAIHVKAKHLFNRG